MSTKQLFDARWFQAGEQKLTDTQARIPGALLCAWLNRHHWLLVPFSGPTPTHAFHYNLADAILQDQVDDAAWDYVERVADAEPYYDLLEELGPDLDAGMLDTWAAAERVGQWLDAFAGVSAAQKPDKLFERARRQAKKRSLLPEHIEALLGQMSEEDAAALVAMLETPADAPLPERYLRASARALHAHAKGGILSLERICLDRGADRLLRGAAAHHLAALGAVDALARIALAVQQEDAEPMRDGTLWQAMNCLQQASLRGSVTTLAETDEVRRLSESLLLTREEPAWAVVIPLLGLIGDAGSMELLQTDRRYELEYQKALKRKAVASIRARLSR